MVRPAFLFALPLLLNATMATAQTPNFLGTWTLDTTHSTSPPGEPTPKSSVMRVTADDGRSFAWNETTVDPEGKSSSVGFRGAFDGKSYPMTGVAGTQLKYTRPSATSFRADGSDPGGGHWTETCSLGADSRTMTCTGTENDPGQAAATYTETWTRR